MRKNAIKSVLFSISSLAALSARANGLPDGLRLIEELPVEQRVVVHQHVMQFLNQNPEVASYAKVIAVDTKGTVYALDEKMEKMCAAGQPSCGGGGYAPGKPSFVWSSYSGDENEER